MKIYGARITQARQIRGLKRYQLAKLVGVSTAELRQYERVHGYQECGCCPVEIDAPDMLVTKIGFALQFPYKFFTQQIQVWRHLIRLCGNRDEVSCLCGEIGTRLCDATIERKEPIYNDTFNKQIIGMKSTEVTCDTPICDNCTFRIGDVDYCQAHHPEAPRVKRRRRAG